LILKSFLRGGKRYREERTIKKHLLIFGVPDKDFTGFLLKHYPVTDGWELLCAEGRPCESILSERLVDFTSRGYGVTVISDNMMGFCLSKKEVSLVVIFYQRIDKDCAYCQGGSLLAAVLAKELNIPCHLCPTDYRVGEADNGYSLYFAGEPIAPRGVRSFVPRVEKVPMSYISEKW